MRPGLNRDRLALLAVAGLLAWLPARTARAGESEWVVAPSASYQVFQVDGVERHGGGLALDVEYGLTDSWALRGSGRYGALYVPGARDPLSLASLGAGAMYTFDVLRIVPFASLAIGASLVAGAGQEVRWNAELQAGLGFDYLVKRDFSVGLEVRYGIQLPDARRFPLFISVAVRLAWRRLY